MTDAEFEKCLEQIEGTTIALSDDDSKPFVAKVRRLRELERACKRLFWRTEHGERYMPAQSLHGTNEREAIATIGRLLEGESHE